MEVVNTALGWIEGKEGVNKPAGHRVEGGLKLEKPGLNSSFENYKLSYLLRAVKY